MESNQFIAVFHDSFYRKLKSAEVRSIPTHGTTSLMCLLAAITIGVRILGPALGFILGSLCTMIYADLSANPQITPTDPRWVGAWWLGKYKLFNPPKDSLCLRARTLGKRAPWLREHFGSRGWWNRGHQPVNLSATRFASLEKRKKKAWNSVFQVWC